MIYPVLSHSLTLSLSPLSVSYACIIQRWRNEAEHGFGAVLIDGETITACRANKDASSVITVRHSAASREGRRSSRRKSAIRETVILALVNPHEDRKKSPETGAEVNRRTAVVSSRLHVTIFNFVLLNIFTFSFNVTAPACPRFMFPITRKGRDGQSSPRSKSIVERYRG